MMMKYGNYEQEQQATTTSIMATEEMMAKTINKMNTTSQQLL